jgi:hypothetical protein
MEKSFNLNNQIKVKISEEGFKHWKQKDDTLFLTWNAGHHVKPLNWYTSKQDDNGYVSLQGWEFMQIFGDSLIPGKKPLFELEIILTGI